MIVRVKEFKGYGLLYYLDDEDEVYSDEFRYLRKVSVDGKEMKILVHVAL